MADLNIFLSYSWGEKNIDKNGNEIFITQELVKIIKSTLSRYFSKDNIWMDVDNLTSAGIPLYEDIARAIRKSDLLITFITKNYTISKNCIKEISLADALDKPIIPILLDQFSVDNWPPENIDIYVCRLLYGNFSGHNGIETINKGELWVGQKEFEALITQLRGIGVVKKDTSNPVKGAVEQKNELQVSGQNQKVNSNAAINATYKNNKDYLETDQWYYIGQVDSKTNLPHGQGTKIWKHTKTSHSGCWEEGICHGPGVRNSLVNVNFGFVNHKIPTPFKNYVGSWDNGILEGPCKITYKSGKTFVGKIFDGDRHDKNAHVFDYTGKLRFVGSYQKDKRTGFGTIFYDNGCEYIGSFLNGKKSGQGTFKFKDGSYIEANFEKNKTIIGTVSVFDPDGIKLTGWNSKGVLYHDNYGIFWLDGSHFWSESNSSKTSFPKPINSEVFEKSGPGIYYKADTYSIEANFSNDKPTDCISTEYNEFGRLEAKRTYDKSGIVTYSELFYEDSKKFVGPIINDKREGDNCQLINLITNKIIYSGSYKNDKREGQGTAYYPNGDKYIGEWKNNSKSGFGEYFYFEDKTSVYGKFWKSDFSKKFKEFTLKDEHGKVIYSGVWPKNDDQILSDEENKVKTHLHVVEKRDKNNGAAKTCVLM